MLSKSAKYAIKALLALADHERDEPMRIADLARKEQIPPKFLELILLGLKHHGMLQSRKGKGGGYLLARDPSEIYLGQIVRMFDGPLAPVPCASQTAYVPCADCPNEAVCGVHLAMKEVRDATARVLDGTSLASLRRQVEQATYTRRYHLTAIAHPRSSLLACAIAYLLYQPDRVYRIMAISLRPFQRSADPGLTTSLPMPPALLRELRQALRSIRYGAIELVIHDGRVVQLERREKVRFDLGLTDRTDGSSDHARRDHPRSGTDRTAGSPPPRAQGDRRMRAVRYLGERHHPGLGKLWQSRHRFVAQQEGTTPGQRPRCRPGSNELDQQVRILQRLRELAADSATAAAKDKVTRDGQQQGRLQHQVGRRQVRGPAQGPGPDRRPLLPVGQCRSRSPTPSSSAEPGRSSRPPSASTSSSGSCRTSVRARPCCSTPTSDVKFSPAFAVRVGKFKPPVDLERLQSASDIVFAERALATNLAPNRDVGLQVSGDISSGSSPTQAGIFNGVPDLGNGDGDVSDAKDFAGRIFLQPFKTGSLTGLGLGVAGSTGLERGTTAAPAARQLPHPRPADLLPLRRAAHHAGQQRLSPTASRTRLAPQAYFYTGPLGLHGEYILSWQEVTRSGVDDRQAAAQGVAGRRARISSPARRPASGAPRPRSRSTPRRAPSARSSWWRATASSAIDDATFPTFANPASTRARPRRGRVGLNWYLAEP